MKSQFRTIKSNQMNRNQISGLNKLELCRLVAVDIPPQRVSAMFACAVLLIKKYLKSF